MRILIPLMTVVMALAGCAGQAPTTSSRPSTPAVALSSSPSGAPATRPSELLFAVLKGASVENRTQASTVAIVGLDGVDRANATFQPRKAPYLGNVADILQIEAQVGRQGVYVIDGFGVVRLLKPSGQFDRVATFAMTPEQHEAWYAVSPDGRNLLAGVLKVPAVGPTPPNQPWPTLVGDWKFDLESARAGGPTTVLQHVQSAQHPDDPASTWKPIFPVGWTQSGPVAMVGASLATQNAWYGGPLFTIDAAGHPAGRIGGAQCTGARILPSGLVACAGADLSVTVSDLSGNTLWKPPVDGFDARRLMLAPEGAAITDGIHVATRTEKIAMPNGFVVQGWLDAQTVAGRQRDGNLSFIRLSEPGTVRDLGFKGDFVGPLPAAA